MSARVAHQAAELDKRAHPLLHAVLNRISTMGGHPVRRLMRQMLVFTALWPLVTVSQERAHALLLQVTGEIGPAMADYVTRNLHKAQTQGAALAIIEMDTPVTCN